MEFIPYVGMKNRKFKKRIHNGMFIMTDPFEHIQQQILWYGYYEKKYILTFEKMVKEDSIVLDIGANIGYYSLVAAGKVVKGRVYSFEADKRNVQRLKENVDLNRIKTIEVIPDAVLDENSNKEFYYAHPENTGMSGLSKPENVSSSEIVRTITIDSWAQQNHMNRIDLVKIDIEGAEYKALMGMKKSLQQFKPVLFIEISEELLKRNGNSAAQVFEFLYSLGYSSYQIKKPNLLEKVNSVVEDELVVFKTT